MNRRNSLIALSAGILFGTLAFVLLYQKASEVEKKTTPIQVLVASGYIPIGSILKPDLVKKTDIPENYVSPSAIRDIREVEGFISLVPISAGEQILSNKFGTSEESLALDLNPGYRAYTLPVNETNGVGNLIRPGNHVDVLTKVSSQNRELTSFVFQDLKVLAVGQRMTSPSQSKKNQEERSSAGEDSDSYGTVTLEVTPEQAETLMFLEGQNLRLVLRSPSDDEILNLPPQSGLEIIEKLGHFSVKTSRSIEIIRGNSK